MGILESAKPTIICTRDRVRATAFYRETPRPENQPESLLTGLREFLSTAYLERLGFLLASHFVGLSRERRSAAGLMAVGRAAAFRSLARLRPPSLQTWPAARQTATRVAQRNGGRGALRSGFTVEFANSRRKPLSDCCGIRSTLVGLSSRHGAYARRAAFSRLSAKTSSTEYKISLTASGYQ